MAAVAEIQRWADDGKMPKEMVVDGVVDLQFGLADRTFRKVIETLSALCDEVVLVCEPDGLNIRALDGAQVVLVDFSLNSASILHYFCEKRHELPISLTSLLAALKAIDRRKDDDRVLWFQRVRDDFSTLRLRVSTPTSGAKTKTATTCGWFNVKLTDGSMIPSLEYSFEGYDVLVEMSSEEYHGILDNMRGCGDTMQLKATEEGITFVVEGLTNGSKVVLKPGTQCKMSITVNRPVDDQKFNLKYLCAFSQAFTVATRVQMRFSKGAPFSVTYMLDDSGRSDRHLSFLIAAKVQTD